MQTFKPGDWVHFSWGKPFILTEKDYKYFKDCNTLYSWQPLPNAWCWFWNDSNTLVLAQFSHGLANGAKFTSKNLMYQYCEPFIGQLPTILQPQSKG